MNQNVNYLKLSKPSITKSNWCLFQLGHASLNVALKMSEMIWETPGLVKIYIKKVVNTIFKQWYVEKKWTLNFNFTYSPFATWSKGLSSTGCPKLCTRWVLRCKWNFWCQRCGLPRRGNQFPYIGGVATYPSAGGRRETHGCVFQERKMHGVATNVYLRKMSEKPEKTWSTNFKWKVRELYLRTGKVLAPHTSVTRDDSL